MITSEQRKQMEHALGLNKKPKENRNYFYTDKDDSDWIDLVNKGLAIKKSGWDDVSAYFVVTEEGKKFLLKDEQC